MAPLPATEPKRLPDGGPNRALRGEANRTVGTTASATVLPVPSPASGRTVAFDHRPSLIGSPRRRSRWGWFSFIIVVAVPAVIAAAYYFFVAAD